VRENEISLRKLSGGTAQFRTLEAGAGHKFCNAFVTVWRDDVYSTTLLWQNNGRQNGHISRTI